MLIFSPYNVGRKNQHRGEPVAIVNIEIMDNPADVRLALQAIGLTSEKVIRIAEAAAAARSEYLPDVDPVNYPGTQAHHAGVRHLRLQTLPAGWRAANFRNIEVVVNDDLGIMLAFQNVDQACKQAEPQAISPKGEATRDLVSKPHAASLFSNDTPQAVQPLGNFPAIWFICVSASIKRLEVEVSRPKPFEGDRLDGFFERIFVADKEMDASVQAAPATAPEIEQDFDVVISKK
ncbi:hypothetical protein [Pseudomonas fulva]|uniref:hypothetical protein n=1 Tax=Pseudomonas fulva TaxID=47880 RepID=UPI0032EB9B33